MIQELQGVHKPSSGRPTKQKVEAILAMLQQLDSIPALPRAAWESLIVKSEVCSGLLTSVH
jgi:hypothetical protein